MIEDGVLSKHRVVDIECAFWSSFALTEDGLLFGWGDNGNNQVKPGDTSDVFDPFLMSEDVSELFSLGSSGRHIFFRKKGGEIGFCGHNFEGQLGNGNNFNITGIQTLKELGGIKSSEIKSIFSNYNASFILTIEGEVFSTGKGEYSGFSGQMLSWTKLEFPEGEKVVDITCGYEHTLFMTSQGRIFLSGERKRLGDFLMSTKGNWPLDLSSSSLNSQFQKSRISVSNHHYLMIFLSNFIQDTTLTLLSFQTSNSKDFLKMTWMTLFLKIL